MTAQPFSHPIRVSDLRRKGGAEFDLRPESEALLAIADALGVTSLRKVRLAGRLVPEGREDWILEGQLGATVIQPCVITLAPVTTRIDEQVQRRWLKHMPEIEGDEVEMPDDALEPLGAVIDLGTVLVEALALSVPEWPRAAGVAETDVDIAAPTDPDSSIETHRPFAGLGALRDRLAGAQPAQPEEESETFESPRDTDERKR